MIKNVQYFQTNYTIWRLVYCRRLDGVDAWRVDGRNRYVKSVSVSRRKVDTANK
jgi:hypothetical protein